MKISIQKVSFTLIRAQLSVNLKLDLEKFDNEKTILALGLIYFHAQNKYIEICLFLFLCQQNVYSNFKLNFLFEPCGMCFSYLLIIFVS